MFELLEDRVHEALRAAGVSWALGGFDLSANEHQRSAFVPHYRPQLWFAVRTSEIRGGERVFRSFFPGNQLVRRPIRIANWDGYPGALAYALKPHFVRRISLAEGNTRIRDLLAAQKVETALAMHAAGPMSRLFLHGLELAADDVGLFRLRRSRSP